MGGRTLILVWLALLLLLALTLAASLVLTGPASLTASLGIAFAKIALIFWFFMHLREESGLVRLAALGAGAWLMILLLLAGADYATRSPSAPPATAQASPSLDPPAEPSPGQGI